MQVINHKNVQFIDKKVQVINQKKKCPIYIENFLLHLVTGWHLLCRIEITIKVCFLMWNTFLFLFKNIFLNLGNYLITLIIVKDFYISLSFFISLSLSVSLFRSAMYLPSFVSLLFELTKSMLQIFASCFIISFQPKSMLLCYCYLFFFYFLFLILSFSFIFLFFLSFYFLEKTLLWSIFTILFA